MWRQKDDKKQVLLIRQFAHGHKWGIPKGHVDKGETVEACAVREIREETGIVAELIVPLPDVMTFTKTESKTVKSWLAMPTVDSEPDAHSDPDSEVAAAKWFDVESLPPIHDYQRPVIDAALQLLNEQTNT